MFFKNSISMVLLAGTLSSCSWLRDEPKAQKSFENEQLDLSCLQTMPNQAQELFAGRYGEGEEDQNSVRAIWSCLDRSLNTFAKYTHGSDDNYYTANELMDFANRYLPKNRLFSPSLVNAIFKLKTSVLGGTDQNISRTEILKLRGKLNRFGEIILPLSPYISTLLKTYESPAGIKNQNVGGRLNEFVAEFAILLEDSENTVNWTDLSSFVFELEKYLASPDPTSLTVVREQTPVFQQVKLLAVGGDPLGIEKTKWRPIFKSISSIYNALYTTADNNEMMDQLNIDIESTDEEQINATTNLTSTLKAMKKDSNLYSKKTIRLFADRWAKVLILNSFLYPKNSGKLSIRAFIGSADLRKLTALLIDDAMALQKGDQSTGLITRLTENLAQMIEQASLDQVPLDLAELRAFASKQKDLFLDEAQYQIVDSGLSLLQDLCSVLIGKESGLTSRDFRALLKKSNDLYAKYKDLDAASKTGDSIESNKALSQALEILIRPPFASRISTDQILNAMKKAESIVKLLDLENPPKIDWAKLRKMVVSGAKIKSILFNNSDKTLTNAELSQLTGTWKAFTRYSDMDEALEELAKSFKSNPYSSANIPELLKAIDTFLPSDKKLAKLGITASFVGSAKALLIGGKSDTLDRSEYARLAQVGATLYKRLKPLVQDLPSSFKLGLDSKSLAIFEAAVQGLMDDRDLKFSNLALRELLGSSLRDSGLKVNNQTLDLLLIGLNFRMLDGNKGKKPSTYPASFSSQKLGGIRKLIEQAKADFLDLEQAFKGIPETQSLPQNRLLERLSRPTNKMIVKSLHPIMNGKTSKPFFTSDARLQNEYYLVDLKYKTLIYEALLWVYPAYEIDPDPRKPNNLPRLSLNDLNDLFDDINDAVYEFGLSFSRGSAEESAQKRKQNINLFTSTGNGDDYVDVIETVDFLTTTLAGKNLLNEVRESLVKDCYPQQKDYKAQTEFSYACLRSAFFEKSRFIRFYQEVVPQMSSHFAGLNATDQDQFRKSVLTAVKAKWTENSMMPLTDLETMVAIPYYVESIFLRLDADRNGFLKFTEAMAGFPVFCREIKKAGGSNVKGSCEEGEDPRQVEAIYGHLILKGVPPEAFSPDNTFFQKARIAKDFLVWTVRWKKLSRNPTARDQEPPYLYRKDLLGIISNLSTSIAPAPPLDQP